MPEHPIRVCSTTPIPPAIVFQVVGHVYFASVFLPWLDGLVQVVPRRQTRPPLVVLACHRASPSTQLTAQVLRRTGWFQGTVMGTAFIIAKKDRTDF